MDRENLRLLWWVIGICISAVIIIALFTFIDIRAVFIDLVYSWKPPIVTAIICSLFGNLVFAAFQWKAAYDQMGVRTSLGEHMFVKTAVYGLRAVPPIRHGGVGRSHYMSRAHGIPREKSHAAVVLVEWVNALVMLVVAILGLLMGGHVGWVLPLLLAFGVALVAGAEIRNALVRGEHERGPKDNWWRSLKRYVQLTRVPAKSFWTLFFYGLLLLLCRILAAALVASALGVAVPWRTALTYYPVAILVAAVPVAYFGTGLRELAFFVTISGMGANESVLAMGILFSIVDQLPIVIPGLATMAPFIFACRVEDWPSPRPR